MEAADPESGAIAPLFHPRNDHWEDHFEWNDHELQGLSAVGRATISALRINDPDMIELRQLLTELGLFRI